MSELRVQASPLLYDIDHDGQNEIVIATLDGEVYFAAYVRCGLVGCSGSTAQGSYGGRMGERTVM